MVYAYEASGHPPAGGCAVRGTMGFLTTGRNPAAAAI